MTIHNIKLSKVSTMHYFKLCFRSVLFLSAVYVYIYSRLHHLDNFFGGVDKRPGILYLIWIVYVVEMILRFFPSNLESMGCQKQFAQNFIVNAPDAKPITTESWRVWSVVIAWFLLNGVFAALYLTGIFDTGIMLLIALAYSVCDIICILFFCPFQTWFMKNKCCATCRIYNWDYPMMFTPLIFIPSRYTWSLVAFSWALLFRWEYQYHRHPERFSEVTNASLACANCPEKLCHHKKQLRSFQKKNLQFLKDTGNFVYVQTRKYGQDLVAGVRDLSSELLSKSPRDTSSSKHHR